MTRLSLAAMFFLLPSLSALAQARDMQLTALIQALQEQGYSIVYSNSLVHAGQRVTVDDLDIQSLRGALEGLGLRLQASQGVWTIVRGDPAPVPESAPADPAEADTALETVIVTGSVHRFPAIGSTASAHSFDSADMSLVPSVASDAMRVTLRLPGVSSVGVSAKPQIRGGLKDELLVMQDGVELLEPFHLADYHSAYSSIDYHTIESLDVYTGGFPSRYGNRMSGVMDIQNKWADDEYNTDIGISTFANFIHTRGESDHYKPVSWLLSLRQGDLTDLADYIETRSGDPKYLDGSARFSVTLSDTAAAAFGVVYAEDDIVFKGEDERASSKIETGYIWGALDTLVKPSLRSHLTASWLDFQRQKNLDSFEDEPKGGFLDHRQEVQRLALRNDWSALRGGSRFEFGWQAEYNSGDYDHVSVIDRGLLADILDTQRLVARDIVLQPDGWSGGSYLQAEWLLLPRLTIQPSLRWDVQDYYLERDDRHQLSPRLGLAYDINDDTRARLSLGRFYQPEGIQELQVLDGVTRFFRPQHSDQVVAGVEWHTEALQLVAEVYYKQYDDQKGRFENIFNPFVLLPEMEPDRVGLYPDEADAKGLDLDLSWRLAESLFGQLRYSYMDARDRIDGQWVDRRWSQKNTVNAGVTWQKDDFSFALAATWHSGWRSTKLPEYVEAGEVIPVGSVLNNTELREYFSLDVSAQKSWPIGRTRLRIYADISNLTDRQNQAGIDYDVEEVEGGYELMPDQEALLGRVTSLGVTLSF